MKACAEHKRLEVARRYGYASGLAHFWPRVGDDRSINGILDVGSLVLELWNVNLAPRWLRMCLDMEAAVHFNE